MEMAFPSKSNDDDSDKDEKKLKSIPSCETTQPKNIDDKYGSVIESFCFSSNDE